MTFGDRLKRVRGKLTQAEFAGKLGVATKTLGFYERNERSPDLDFVKTVCSFGNVSADWLIFGSDAPGSTGASRCGAQQEAKDCPRCAWLEGQLEKSMTEQTLQAQEMRAINTENRTLWRENGELRESVARLEERKHRLASVQDGCSQDSGAA